MLQPEKEMSLYLLSGSQGPLSQLLQVEKGEGTEGITLPASHSYLTEDEWLGQQSHALTLMTGLPVVPPPRSVLLYCPG